MKPEKRKGIAELLREWEDFRREMQNVIEEQGHFPTYTELFQSGRSDLMDAAHRHHGGLWKVRKRMALAEARERMGLAPRQRGRPLGPAALWENLAREMNQLKERLGFYPNTTDLLAMGRYDLKHAIERHGGMFAALPKLEGREPRPPENAGHRWNGNRRFSVHFNATEGIRSLRTSNRRWSWPPSKHSNEANDSPQSALWGPRRHICVKPPP